jgi:hypothetical protein
MSREGGVKIRWRAEYDSCRRALGWVTKNVYGDQSMRKLVPGLVVAVGMVLSASAFAGPIVNQVGLVTALDDAGVIQQVAQGCGPGWHRGPYGRCRPNRGPVVVTPGVAIAPPVVVVPRARWCHRSFSSRNFRC